MTADTAPAAMPSPEDVARLVDAYAFKSWQQAHDYEIKTTGDAEEAVRFADWSVGKRVDEAREKARAILALFAPILAEKERVERNRDMWKGQCERQALALHELRLKLLEDTQRAEARALAAEAALAAERERVCDVTTAMCEKWIATFSGREINHTPAHEYAEGAVRDIIDQVAAIRAQGDDLGQTDVIGSHTP